MNPIVRQLGFSAADRIVILHADDVGVCESSVSGADELWQIGTISSCAVMVPCPWFPAAAALYRARPALKIDMGVHLTLTCEWDAMRWAALSTRDPASGLIDAEGYMHRSYQACIEQGQPDAVLLEFDAQVARAIAAGIRPTHIDSHMGTAQHPRFLPAFAAIARKHRLPLFIPRAQTATAYPEDPSGDPGQAAPERPYADPANLALARRQIEMLDEAGIAMPDHFGWTHLSNHEDKVGELKAQLMQLKPGITHFVMHPAKDTPELRALCPDWRARAAEFEALRHTDLRQWMREQGIQIIGYAALMGG